MNMNAVAQILQTVVRATLLLSLVVVPAMAMEGMRAGDENVIEGSYKASSGAGLVLMISLRRAR